jgi:hypothetical protein
LTKILAETLAPLLVGRYIEKDLDWVDVTYSVLK